MLAVKVQDANLWYGRGKDVTHVLRGLNMRVPEGVIYGLLGPSGCGKTSLLTSVVGQRTLKQGQIQVFGKEPGSRDSGIPGSWVGYMPQELALFPEFTIEETLTYFGRLHCVVRETLQERTDFLLMFLDLPSKDRFVKDLSGGQQRRVSLAAALIHRPPLLILDEPTVGVDPLLREVIWKHLVQLTSVDGMTVIITTHYIEEARQANIVGLMRKGRLLAETGPTQLIQMVKEPTLEDCFLKLCLMDKENNIDDIGELTSVAVEKPVPVTYSVSNGEIIYGFQAIESTGQPASDALERTNCVNAKRSATAAKVCALEKVNPISDSLCKTYALTAKNMIRLWRSIIVVLFQFALPVIQVILFCVCIGHNPYDLPLAVVNNEVPAGISKFFLERLDNRTITQKPFLDIQSALQSVKDGKTWGALEIGPTFTQDLVKRFTFGVFVDNATLEGSTINVYLDLSNQQNGIALQAALLFSFQTFAKDVLQMYGANPGLAELPVVLQTPVYGSPETTFTEFITPGVVLCISYILAIGLTALSCIEERRGGTFDRSLVSGVTPTQALISHVLTQSVVLFFQVFGLLLFTFAVFKIPCHGPFILVIFMVLLQGTVGMSYGLAISALVTQEGAAIMIALGSFFPHLVLSGIVWPLEGMPHFLRIFCYCLPQTLATEALRAIVSKGWDLGYVVVWQGFLVSIAWIAFYLIAAVAIFRLKK